MSTQNSRPNYILGISCYYHDSAATLIKDGQIIAAAEEERFTGIKHDNAFPENAIKFCLQFENITIEQISAVAFYEKPLLKLERVLLSFLHYAPVSFKAFILALPLWLSEKISIGKVLKKKLKYTGDVFYVPHHLSHAASAFFPSGFDSAAIVTIDGAGEWSTTAFGSGRDNQVALEKEVKFPHSLGLFYSALTSFLGFRVNGDEFKMMGLAAFGEQSKNANEPYAKLKKTVDVKPDGSFALDMKYYAYGYSGKMFSKHMTKLLGKPRQPHTEITHYHQDIAAAVQMIFEEMFFSILNHVAGKTGEKNLVLAGGAIQNSAANGKILDNTNFEKIWIPPSTTDAGAAAGAALYVWHCIWDKPRTKGLPMTYLGPRYSEEEIKKFLDENNIAYQRLNKLPYDHLAYLLYRDKIIAWFSGRMEFGPRALGNRSILASPLKMANKEKLNISIKQREEFRPFGPVVTAEDAGKYFEVEKAGGTATDFMAMALRSKPGVPEKIPAAVHVDGTARVQTISRMQNEKYYDLLREFEKISGVPVLINTSFNVAGQPIVCTPKDAYECFVKSGLDFLVLEDFLISKSAL